MKQLLLKLHHLYRLVKDDYPYLGLMGGLYVVSASVLPFYHLWLYAAMINALFHKGAGGILLYAVLLVGGTFGCNLINILSRSRLQIYENTLYVSAKKKLNQKVYQMQYAKYETQETLDLLHSIEQQQNAAGGPGMVLDLTLQWFTSILIVLFSIGFTGRMLYEIKDVFALNDFSLWAMLVIGIVVLAAGSSITRKVQVYFNHMMEQNVHGNTIGGYILNESGRIQNLKDIKVYDFRNVFDHYLIQMYSLFDAFLKYANLEGGANALTSFAMILFSFASYVFITRHAYQGHIAIGDVVLYAGAIQNLALQLNQCITTYHKIHFRMEYLDQYDAFISDQNMDYDGTLPIEKRNDHDYQFELKDVSFKYPGTDVYALKHVNLKFRVGEKMAVVGKNGAGKTTLVKLLCRFYEPTSGEILLNGINIRKYNYEEYTSIFAPVFQDFTTFSLTVAQNVTGSYQKFDEPKLWEALDRVGLKDKILSMPDGVNTLLNHENGDGVDFSGGEAQKLAIARALYKDAPFVILDEPTAALDPVAEAEIYEHFNDLIQNKTSIYISHRMSSCKFCDRIVVFKDGEIEEIGTHQELLKRNGEYASLYLAQAEYYQSK